MLRLMGRGLAEVGGVVSVRSAYSITWTRRLIRKERARLHCHGCDASKMQHLAVLETLATAEMKMPGKQC